MGINPLYGNPVNKDLNFMTSMTLRQNKKSSRTKLLMLES